MLFEGVRKIQDKYGIEIPKEYNKFILRTEMFDYSGKTFKVNNQEYEIGHFLKIGDSSDDLFNWYLLRVPEYKDYLTIAFCIYDEQIAIKVKGENRGKVVLMMEEDETEDISYKIIDVADNFLDFLKMIS